MAESTGTLVDTILGRVRDLGGLATSREVVRLLLSRCQDLANFRLEAAQGQVLLQTQPHQVFYDLPTMTTDDGQSIIKVTQVRDGDRALGRVDWRSFVRHTKDWLRAVGEPAVFATLGFDLLCIWPAPLQPRTLVVIGTVYTTPLTSEETETDLRDDRLDLVLQLTTALVLLRSRMLDRLPAAIQSIGTELGRQDVLPGGGVAG